MDILNTITPFEFGGIANGTIDLSNLIGQAKVRGNVTVEDTEINQFPIGMLAVRADLEESNLILSESYKINFHSRATLVHS